MQIKLAHFSKLGKLKVMKATRKQPQNESNGLWIPLSIVGVGILVSMVFAFQTLKGYRKPRPLLIKPSSVNSAKELSMALYKAVYPLKLQGYGVKFVSSGLAFENQLKTSFKSVFPSTEKNILITAEEINLSQDYNNSKIDCLNTALFNMLRKPERKWKKKIYFSVCTEAEKTFKIFYTIANQS